MTTQDEAKKMFEAALLIEEKGLEFYKKAFLDSENAAVREIYAELITAEKKHIDHFVELYDALKSGDDWLEKLEPAKDVKDSVHKMFKNVAAKAGEVKGNASDIAALDTGLKLENESISFYSDNLKKATEPKEKAFLEALISEERDHHATLTDMKFYLTDPESWFQEKEHSGLDGA